MENLKKMAGIKAAEFVSDGMVVGLGTGSTAYYFVEEIGRRIKEEGLQITAVTTSSVTTKQAEGLNIPLKSIDQVDFVDVTVDGADESKLVEKLGAFKLPVIAFGQELDHVVGVVEHGLFNQMVDKVIVAGRDGVQISTSKKGK
ncbi:ribose-5-phosphate isomerase A [Streptococcus pneumoniae]|uniref:ribose-5-phosphate isomerase A n=1 Tax=Streptococcus pneumoniae TaxID=1313 RepID=UPI000766A956|nr:ribose-5-phosphate isomerase A [Streptococcus pneumoniae]CXF22624.1 ribose-5-phosphate isomerase A [Streptococcus pneumoniae]